MKEVLLASLKNEGAGGPFNETMDAFVKLFKMKKNDTTHRLKTRYSYDVKDDLQYRKSQKIEKRMRKYYSRP